MSRRPRELDLGPAERRSPVGLAAGSIWAAALWWAAWDILTLTGGRDWHLSLWLALTGAAGPALGLWSMRRTPRWQARLAISPAGLRYGQWGGDTIPEKRVSWDEIAAFRLRYRNRYHLMSGIEFHPTPTGVEPSTDWLHVPGLARVPVPVIETFRPAARAAGYGMRPDAGWAALNGRQRYTVYPYAKAAE